MTSKDVDSQQKKKDQLATADSINRQSRGGWLSSYPVRLPALIAILPVFITYRLVHTRLSHTKGLVLGLAVYFGFQIIISIYLRSFLRKHSDLKWQILIR